MVWFGEKANLYYVDTGGFIAYIETDDIYNNIVEYVETIFDTSNYEYDKTMNQKEENIIRKKWSFR